MMRSSTAIDRVILQSGRDSSIQLGLWERVSFTAAHLAAGLLLSVLGLRGLHVVGRLFGSLEYVVNHKRRRRFAAALDRIFDDPPGSAERRRWARGFFQRSRCDKLFYLLIDRIPRDTLATLLEIKNKHLLDEALARGKGVYLAMSHHGPHHVLAMLMAMAGYQTAGVRDRNEGAIRRFVQDRFDRRYPQFQRMRVFFADGYPRDIYRCFRDGFVVGSAMDVSRVRDPSQASESVTVFGETRSFLSGPLRIALRCGTPTLQAFVTPKSGFRYRLDIVASLVDPEKVKDESAAIRDAMQTYAANVETYMQEHPTLLTRM